MDGMTRSLITSFAGLTISLVPTIVSLVLSAAGLAGTTAAFLLDRWIHNYVSLNLIFALLGIPITLAGLKSFRRESRKRARLFSWRESVEEAKLSVL
jgi:hypothetical protein